MRTEDQSDPLPESADQRIAALARSQHGVFTRLQAIELGATKSTIQTRLATVRWVKIYPGVYRHAGVPPTWRQLLLAACFGVGQGADASHRAAAALWQLAGFEQLRALSEAGETSRRA